MNTETKETITDLIKLCKNFDFTNQYDQCLHKLLSNQLFGIDIKDHLTISFDIKCISKECCQSNKLTKFRTKLKDITHAKIVTDILSDFIKNYKNTDKIGVNYTTILAQILYLFKKVVDLDKITKPFIMQHISNDFTKIMPQYCNISNYISNVANQICYDEFDKTIFNEIYELLTSKIYTLEEITKIFNFMVDLQYDIKFIKFMDMIYKKANECNNSYLSEYNCLIGFYSNIVDKDHSLHVDVYRNSLNLLQNLSIMIWGYYSIKRNNEKYKIFKYFIEAYYGLCQIEDLLIFKNRDILTIYLIGIIYKIKEKYTDDLFLDFSEKFYSNLKDYWSKVNSSSGIYFRYDKESIIKSKDIFMNIELFNFKSWNLSDKNYIDICQIIEKLYKSIDEDNVKKTKKKYNIGKTKIPKGLKDSIWYKYIGIEKGVAKCLCCKNNDIYSRNFEAGHVISESNGGTIELNNLRPICSGCNKSMGPMNMNEYQKKCGY